MPVREVLLVGDPALRESAAAVDFDHDDIREIIADLADTLRTLQQKHGIGRALAAPQIGIKKQVLLMEAGGRRVVMINPRIVAKSDESFTVWDSCFSAELAFFGAVRRAVGITVEFLDETGQARREEFRGELSELFQHEIDHLEGLLFTDRIVENRIIMRAEFEKLVRAQGGLGMCRQ